MEEFHTQCIGKIQLVVVIVSGKIFLVNFLC